MIYSASIRTDIPAFYSEWLADKLLNKHECAVRNPKCHEKVHVYDLSPEKTDCIAMTSKNYAPMLKYMPGIIKSYPVMCDYTITAYGSDIEPNVPSIDNSIKTYKNLVNIIGANRVRWRFDPIFKHKNYDIPAIKFMFEYIARNLDGYCHDTFFSFISMYENVKRNFPEVIPLSDTEKCDMMEFMYNTALQHNIKLRCCPSQIINIPEPYKNMPDTSGCLLLSDIQKAYPDINYKQSHAKNAKMGGCPCVISRDIGSYNTCPHKCRYCYANTDKNLNINYDPESLILNDIITDSDIIVKDEQLSSKIRSLFYGQIKPIIPVDFQKKYY